MRLRSLLALVAAAAFVLVPAGTPSVTANPQLLATVGPGFTIQLTHPDGSPVTKVDPGIYDIVVRDLAGEHNFHLSGQGVNELTDVEAVVNVTWTVTFAEARYTFVCDPHSTVLRGQFVAGNPPAPAPTPTPAPAPVKRLTLTVGPAASISLTNAAGRRVTTAKAGSYSILVRDRSKLHNAHLVGPGVNRKSGLAATGTLTWKVKLSAGLLRFFSDRSPKTVKGSIRVT